LREDFLFDFFLGAEDDAAASVSEEDAKICGESVTANVSNVATRIYNNLRGFIYV